MLNLDIFLSENLYKMKHFVLLLALVACFVISDVKAQTINGVKLSDLKEEYLEISEYRKFLGEKIFVSVDYGQEKGARSNVRELVVKGDDGDYLAYSSVMSFINKMKAHGYKLFKVYALTMGENSLPRYILKRKLSKD